MTLSFQDLIFKLQEFWAKQGCVVLQPVDSEVGAGTLHPMTILKTLQKKEWNICYAQSCRRPADSRYGKNPNRLGQYYQFQVILKPAPENIKDLYLESLNYIGIDTKNNDIRFVEDDWENPSVGAFGLGWEVWYNGMEVTQFTYMQQVGDVVCDIVPGEITYGLERIAMHIQNVENIFDIIWKDGEKNIVTYGDVLFQSEYENSFTIHEFSNTDYLFTQFNEYEKQAKLLLEKKLAYAAYEFAIKASHTLNLIDARGLFSVNERTSYLTKVRSLVRDCCNLLIKPI